MYVESRFVGDIVLAIYIYNCIIPQLKQNKEVFFKIRLSEIKSRGILLAANIPF